MVNEKPEPIFNVRPIWQDWIDQAYYGETPPSPPPKAPAPKPETIKAPQSTAPSLPLPEPIPIKPEYSPRQRTIGIDSFMRNIPS